MIAGLALLVATSWVGPVAKGMDYYPVQQSAPKQQQKNTSTRSLTGCIDQQSGQYVLVDDHSLNRIADLEAEGFPTEGFAKHVGHKVTVRGTATADGKQPIFKVRTIETVSETCAPQDE
jgi:hypothetical protein